MNNVFVSRSKDFTKADIYSASYVVWALLRRTRGKRVEGPLCKSEKALSDEKSPLTAAKLRDLVAEGVI